MNWQHRYITWDNVQCVVLSIANLHQLLCLPFSPGPSLFTAILFSLNGSSCVCMKIKTTGDLLIASTTGYHYGVSK